MLRRFADAAAWHTFPGAQRRLDVSQLTDVTIVTRVTHVLSDVPIGTHLVTVSLYIDVIRPLM